MNGVVIVRKEKGMTSFGVVAAMRRIFSIKKIGHTGTLDPDAEGVLPVCIGRATKLVEMLTRGTKTYRAVLLLGVVTDTQDTTGNVIRTSPVNVSEEEVAEAVLSFLGKQKQLPPMYSAVKVNGQKLVDLARRGIEVERKERDVEFLAIRIVSVNLPRVTFEVTCSHGSYIRTLCHDIGRKLGCGGAMDALIRTRVGEFDISDAHTLDEIRERKAAEDAENAKGYSFLIPIDHFFPDLPEAHLLPGANMPAVLAGNPVEAEETSAEKIPHGKELRLYTGDGRFIGIYRRGNHKLRLVRFFFEE